MESVLWAVSTPFDLAVDAFLKICSKIPSVLQLFAFIVSGYVLGFAAADVHSMKFTFSFFIIGTVLFWIFGDADIETSVTYNRFLFMLFTIIGIRVHAVTKFVNLNPSISQIDMYDMLLGRAIRICFMKGVVEPISLIREAMMWLYKKVRGIKS